MLKQGRVVALERTSELLRAASSNVLRFKLDGPLPPEFENKARVTGRIVQLPAHDALEIEQYLAVIRQAGLKVEDVEVRKADLEDVFLDVMSKHGDKAPSDRPSEAGKGPLPASAVDEVTGLEVGS
jgi:ABC-2 type transport system ATP-binding protein